MKRPSCEISPGSLGAYIKRRSSARTCADPDAPAAAAHPPPRRVRARPASEATQEAAMKTMNRMAMNANTTKTTEAAAAAAPGVGLQRLRCRQQRQLMRRRWRRQRRLRRRHWWQRRWRRREHRPPTPPPPPPLLPPLPSVVPTAADRDLSRPRWCGVIPPFPSAASPCTGKRGKRQRLHGRDAGSLDVKEY
jgi:hypothetical protein